VVVEFPMFGRKSVYDELTSREAGEQFGGLVYEQFCFNP
jgi:hypothetical protein